MTDGEKGPTTTITSPTERVRKHILRVYASTTTDRSKHPDVPYGMYGAMTTAATDLLPRYQRVSTNITDISSTDVLPNGINNNKLCGRR